MVEVRSSSAAEKAWWRVIIALGAAAFVLGLIGFHTEYVKEAADAAGLNDGDLEKVARNWDWADIIFNTVGLFVFNAPPWTEVNATLNFARYLAYAATLLAGATALLTLFSERYQAWRLRTWRNHVVVCGLGYKGLTFIQNLHPGRKIVVVEADPNNAAIDDCRALKIPVIIGDATHDTVLRRARLEHAERLLAVCPSDAINTEILLSARSVVEQAGKRDPLRCLAQISHPQLCAMLSDTQIWEDNGVWTADFFNTNDTAATLILDEHPVGAGGEPPHLLVAHLDALGSRLVALAVQRWVTRRVEEGQPAVPLAISIVDDRADGKVEDLKRRFNRLGKTDEFLVFTCSASEEGLAAIKEAWEDANVAPPVRAYVTSAEDDECVATALLLLARLNVSTKVIVALAREHGTGKMLHSSPRVDVVVFPTFERTCTPELLFDVSVKRLAKEIHEIWRETQRARLAKVGAALAKLEAIADESSARAMLDEARALPDETREERERRKAAEDDAAEPEPLEVLRTIKESAAEVDETDAIGTIKAVIQRLTDEQAYTTDPTWEQASDDDRASSMAQAHDIAIKLRSIDGSIQPHSDDAAVEFEFTEDEIERLAEQEHERWNAERRNTGWTLGPKDKANKVTPHLKPFGELDEDVAEWDRVFVRKIPRILRRAGYMPVRNSKPEQSPAL